ncbi:LuxR C-terminal-related transcriptional regulator [Pseudomonas brassicacearum]|uniref:helix-turn-helix transcriptional regulator n=1 Tax=Pseudomonas TaxID=286 RepID=UPI0008121607|nr:MULTISPECIES: helix-turn-helix transcriptional regulator [Pseudomonas]MCM2460261.1 helix-turn-helix transcriptional regulator [Pseudomonas sp. CG7]UVM46758.1 LuxR C-terminal-related transcriptional regulator [Pseudomonas brassicacearum]CRM36495.1 transcriptional regulator NarL [Pseudomonas sp. 31 E 5]CRM52978.1 transcriptional regulator NarL [Pseudomonas sp. 31 E 6]
MQINQMTMTSYELDLFAQVVWRLRTGGAGDEVRQQVLGDVTLLLRSDFGASYLWDNGLSRSTRCAAVNIDAQMLREYDKRIHVNDVLTPALRSKRQAICVDDVISRRSLEQSELYAEFLKPCWMHHGVNIFFFNQGRDVGDLRIWRSVDQPAFGIRELSLLNALTPYFQRALAAEMPPKGALSPRERAVVEHVAAGRSDKEIARIMSIGFTTVRTHLKNAMIKTNSGNRTELAMRMGAH